MSYQPPSGYNPNDGYPQNAPQQPGYPPPPPAAPSQPMYPPAGYAQPFTTPYGAPIAQPDRRGGVAIAGFVLGLLSVVAWLLPICGYPVTIAGIICSGLGLASTQRGTLAKIGLALSILALVATLINSIIGAEMFMRAAQGQ